MCGICGVINFKGLTEEDIKAFVHMLVKNEKRGTDASGMGNQKLGFVKAPIKASEFVSEQKVVDYLSRCIGLKWVVGHTRHATRGNPYVNINNHPLFSSDKKFMLVHNGVVHADCEALRESEDFSKTDSYLIVSAIERNWVEGDLLSSVKKAYDDFAGSASVVALTPQEIVLARRLNPLVVAESGDSLFFASELEFIPHTYTHHFDVPADSALSFDVNGKRGSTRVNSKIGGGSSRFDWRTYRTSWKPESVYKPQREDRNFRDTDYSSQQYLGRPSDGSGWFGESRRHREAVVKGQRSRRRNLCFWRLCLWNRVSGKEIYRIGAGGSAKEALDDILQMNPILIPNNWRIKEAKKVT